MVFEHMHHASHNIISQSKSTLDDVDLAVNIVREIKRAGLLFAQRSHDFKTFDCDVGGFHRLET